MKKMLLSTLLFALLLGTGKLSAETIASEPVTPIAPETAVAPAETPTAVPTPTREALPELTELLLFNEVPMFSAATLLEQKLLDAPAAINVVTYDEIQLRGYTSLKDVMLDLPGWTDVSDANENIVAVRGGHTSATNKILIMVNGHRMNDLNLGRYNTDMFLGLEGVDRIEFIRGAGSVLYGTGALMGVVNIVMKKGAKAGGFTLKPRFSLFENTNRSYEGHATWGGRINEWDISFAATFINSEGAQINQDAAKDRAPVGQTPAAGKIYWNQYPKNWNAYVNLGTEGSSLDIRAEHTSRTVPRACSTFSLIDYELEQVKPDYEQDDIFINFKKDFALDANSKITLNPSFHDFALSELTWISTYGANRLPPYGSRSGQITHEQHWQMQALYENQVLDNLNIIGGLDFLLTDFQSSWTFSVSSDGRSLNLTPYRMDYSTWLISSALAQAVWSPLTNLEVTLSGRYDMFQNIAKPRFTPRAAVVYKPLEDLAVKLVYGQSYLSPQWAHVKSSQVNNAFLANTDLNSETFEGLDLIVAYQKNNLLAELDFFGNRTNGLISASRIAGTTTQIYVNADQTTYKGGDASVKYRLMQELMVNGGYSFVINAGSSTSKYVLDNTILGIPQHIGRLGFQVTPWDGLDLMLWGRAYSEVLYKNAAGLVVPIPAWGTVDATLNYRLAAWFFQVGAYNLSDQKVEIGSAELTLPLPRPGRSYTAAVSYTF